ncbi:MAG: tripartite tricarboxylate transporter permease [Lachnospiraceae bacterium]|nr:tripartite tricarboxylate transporter permease [Lachnospiraceae bacterium]
MLENLVELLTSDAIIWLIMGVSLGLVFGAIPGLSATLAVVLLIPFTYSLSAETGIATLIGAYVGGISGGLVAAIMINMPGTPSSVATTFDGFPMAKQGRAGKALGVGVISSFFGTLFSWGALVLFAPKLSAITLKFGPYEMVGAILFGLTAVISLSGESLHKGLVSAALGLALCLIGIENGSFAKRATFNNPMLAGGIPYMPALIGMFVISEVLNQFEKIDEKYLVPKQKLKGAYMTLKEFIESLPNMIRSSFVGLLIGILPGIGGSFANFVTYDLAKRSSKHPETFGKGNYQGVVASESGNNATIGGALIPMVCLGIPGDIVTAALMGGLMLKNASPGPYFMREHGDLANTIFNSLLIASLVMLVIMLLIAIRVFAVVLRLPKYVMLPLVLVMALAGIYNINYSIPEMFVGLIMGVFGYMLDKFKYPKTPLVITLILGKSLELYFRRGLVLSSGSLLPFVQRPYSLAFLILTVIALAVPFVSKARKKAKAKEENGNTAPKESEVQE